VTIAALPANENEFSVPAGAIACAMMKTVFLLRRIETFPMREHFPEKFRFDGGPLIPAVRMGGNAWEPEIVGLPVAPDSMRPPCNMVFQSSTSHSGTCPGGHIEK